MECRHLDCFVCLFEGPEVLVVWILYVDVVDEEVQRWYIFEQVGEVLMWLVLVFLSGVLNAS